MIPYINIHTHLKHDNASIELYNMKVNEACDAAYCSFGLHPWELGKGSEKQYLDKLNVYCENKVIAAVGEVGLDKAIEYPITLQEEWFIKQHELAEKHKLPVIIHCVKSWNELMGLHKKVKPRVPWIFHGFAGNLILADQLIKAGCYLSFGQQLLKNEKQQRVFKDISLENVFLETDDSDEKIDNIYKKAADLHHICSDNLKEQIYSNFRRIFK